MDDIYMRCMAPAVGVGADVIIAEGSEAGGHGGRRSTLLFVPAVVELR